MKLITLFVGNRVDHVINFDLEEEQMVETGLRGEKITCYGPSTILRAHKNPTTRHLVQQSVGLPHFGVIGTIVGDQYLYP